MGETKPFENTTISAPLWAPVRVRNRGDGGGSEPRGISAQKASKNRLRSEDSNGGLIYTEGDSRSFADMIFTFFTNRVSENHPSRFWPSERISRTAASNSSIAFSAATSFIATIRS